MKQFSIKLFLVTLLLICFSVSGFAQVVIMSNSSTPVEVGDADSPSRFYDPGGTPTHQGDNHDAQGRFGQGISDTLVLHASVLDAQLYVIFEDFSVGTGDTLYIFDGPSTESPLVDFFNSVKTPGERTASGEYMTFVFHSDTINDPGDLGLGWTAQAYSYVATPTTYYLDADNSGMDYITCHAKLVDHGGANGNIGNSQSGWCNVISPVGTHVVASKLSFNVGGTLLVYDGQYYDPNKRVIGKFHSSTAPPPAKLISSQNALSFEYVAGSGDQSKSGWEFDITCVDEIFEVPDGSACPQITISSPDSMGNYVDMDYIESDCHNPVYVLKANITATGPYTYDYTVTQIPYNPPFAFNAGTVIPANTDDDWITNTGVELPFIFSFYGQTYARVYPGANGLISFTQRTGTCAWSTSSYPSIADNPPYSNTPYYYTNCLYGVYEDIFPGHYLNNGAIRYGVMGQSPCRTFVFNYDNVGLYSCYSSGNNMYNSYQMVIYEGTNILDVYVRHRACCSGWNAGYGVIGIQNATSSQMVVAPGRDFGPNWTADNEAWRFTPITTMDPNGTLDWYEESIDSASIGQGKKLVVSPTRTTNYIVKYTYANASGQHFTSLDTILVHVDIPEVEAVDITSEGSTGLVSYCPGAPVDLHCEVGQSTAGIIPVSYRWSSGDTTQNCTVNPNESTTYNVEVTYNNGCKNNGTVDVQVTDLSYPTIDGNDHICAGKSTTLTATLDSALSFRWDNGQNGNTITVSPLDTTDYVVTAVLEGDCQTKDTFTVYVMPNPVAAFTVTPTDVFVEGGEGRVFCTNLTTPEDIPNTWNFGDTYSDPLENVQTNIDNPEHNYTRPGNYSINLTVVDTNECRDSVAHQVSVTVPFFFYVPNSFTPDGDGNNDVFIPKGEGVEPESYSMLIYDRNGSLQFKSGDPQIGWDGNAANGKPCAAGVYVYQITFKTMNGEEKLYSGSVTLVK